MPRRGMAGNQQRPRAAVEEAIAFAGRLTTPARLGDLPRTALPW